MDNEELGKLMGEYASLIQTISDAENRIREYDKQLKAVAMTLTDGHNRVNDHIGRGNWQGSRSWKINERGNLLLGVRDEEVPRDLVGQLCDTLGELAAACEKKGEIDAALKQAGHASLIKY